MAEYITKEQAIDEVWASFTFRDDPDLGRVIEENIERLPAADVAPVSMTNWEKYQDVYLKYFIHCVNDFNATDRYDREEFGSGIEILFNGDLTLDEKVLYLSKWFAQEYDIFKDFKQGQKLYIHDGEKYYGDFIGIFGNSFVIDKRNEDVEFYSMHPEIPTVEVIELNKARNMGFTAEEEEYLY